jgi:molybdenum cofactor guanylyltransferase
MTSSLTTHSDTADANWRLLVLAGGRGSRCGFADKGLIDIQGRPAVLHLEQRLCAPQMHVSANRHLDVYRSLGIAAFPDNRPDYSGPLAGLERLLQEPGADRVVVLACDMPYVPDDLALRMLALLDHEDVVVAAHDGQRLQHLCLAFYAPRWRQSLIDFLNSGGKRVQDWVSSFPVLRVCEFSSPSAFINLNTMTDYHDAAIHFAHDKTSLHSSEKSQDDH